MEVYEPQTGVKSFLKILPFLKIEEKGKFIFDKISLVIATVTTLSSSGLFDTERFYISAFILFGQSSKLDFIHDFTYRNVWKIIDV